MTKEEGSGILTKLSGGGGNSKGFEKNLLTNGRRCGNLQKLPLMRQREADEKNLKKLKNIIQNKV